MMWHQIALNINDQDFHQIHHGLLSDYRASEERGNVEPQCVEYINARTPVSAGKLLYNPPSRHSLASKSQ